MSYGNFLSGGLQNLSGLLGAFSGIPNVPFESKSGIVGEPESYTLYLRVIPIAGRLQIATPFIVMMDELEERFLAVHCGSYVAIRVIEIPVFGGKRQELEATLERHGYRILDET